MFETRWFLALILLLLPTLGNAQETRVAWIVVVNTQSEVESLSQKQVMGFFLGRSKFLPSGAKVKAIDYPVDSEFRSAFYTALTGKNIADIDAYWARLRYSGRATPPQPLADSEEIIQALQQQVSAIAYLPASLQDTLAAKGLKSVLAM